MDSLARPMEKPLSQIDAVLFDFDGTILDTYDVILESMRFTMRTVLGKELDASTLMEKVGQPLAVQMMDFAGDEVERDELLSVYRGYNAEIHDSMVKPFDGVEKTLSELVDRGYPLGIVTSKRHSPALHGLKLFGLEVYFDCLVGADDCDTHKPEPGPLIYGAELLGVPVKNCIYVGDSPFDIQAGKRAGAVTVAALWGMFSQARLRAEKPDFECEDIGEILTLLA